MFVHDVKESTKKQVQVSTSAEISEMVTFNKTGQAIQWVHAVDYEKLTEQIAEANKILNLAEFEDLTGAHKIHWSAWQALRAALNANRSIKEEKV